ncbi:MAG: hypothetical protein CFH10_00208, partial [Alphaproteobacteria bacterium MarineAlpha4_Bin2]
KDAQNLLARYRAVPKAVDEEIAALEADGVVYCGGGKEKV